MTRFNGYTQEDVRAYSQHDDEYKTGRWSFVYGFDTGGLLGNQSSLFGYFVNAWFQREEDEEMHFQADYELTGGKDVIINSPFWGDIVLFRPDHVKYIVADLPIPQETSETIAAINKYWKEAGLFDEAIGDGEEFPEEIEE
ncbi:hypothetical protein N9E35_01495 [Candidatus Marinimicrobia bacterium]|nr:hypothetical protein [Candidatus Neomarinimicrobiota bacterium]